MEFTLHYLDDTFNIKNFTLEVKEVFGSHTGDMIKEKIQKIFSRWVLQESSLAMMLCDSGSNIVKARNDWRIDHYP